MYRESWAKEETAMESICESLQQKVSNNTEDWQSDQQKSTLLSRNLEYVWNPWPYKTINNKLSTSVSVKNILDKRNLRIFDDIKAKFFQVRIFFINQFFCLSSCYLVARGLKIRKKILKSFLSKYLFGFFCFPSTSYSVGTQKNTWI